MTLSARPTRRAVLGALAAAPLAACATGAPAPAVRRFRAVTIDAGPFAAKGVPNYAARVAEAARAAIPSAFAGRLDPSDRNAPTLVIEIAGVSLAAWTGSGRSPFTMGVGAGDATDWMDGALVVRAPSGAVIDRRPHISSRAAASSGAWYDPENETRRMRDLAALYVAWAAKEYGD
ncbi:hypothetical protein EYW49_08155 [Siculibacillus lacustris]|uniref:DUF3313 domain-containing protein n=1 Tax=Siculibacillus lacustris TaxID=1549641 RepID=A0A4Q9VU53_9HYPH|nr:hypothetical protein [Siculibacillus lacustris]TBW38663.1 hypothetical protein EYW49_08155 [Siculibacillus lacustris]